jgi:MoaA/NifB/PqqE/SkfB family radical SAM enzyme
MRIRNNLERTFSFLINHRNELFTHQFWAEALRVYKLRFDYANRISHAEFLQNLKYIEIRPWNLHVEVTNICNANCIFCAYRFQTRKKMFMSEEIYSKTLQDYCAIGGGELRIESCVGDPLVDLNFLERVQEARSHPEITKITTLTNGISLDRVGIEKLLESGINEISISMGPWEEKLYQAIYRCKDYQRVRQNVTQLLKMNGNVGFPLSIKICFRSNLSMKRTLGLPDYKAIRHFPHEIEFNTDFDTWLRIITQKDLLRGMHIRPIIRLEREPCYWFYDGPMVFADGKVGLCGCRDFDANSELIVGDILKDSLLDIWQSEAVCRLREQFWKGDFPDICRKCTTYANLDFYRSKRGSLRAKMITEREL